MRISCGKEKWQMQLLYFITNRADRIPAVLARLSEAGVNGPCIHVERALHQPHRYQGDL